MKKILLSLALLLTSSSILLADGGMWLPILVGDHIKDMQANGFKLSAEDVYSVNKACMKDAVLQFGGGCTGEIVSAQGLLLTNHHCGRGQIQSHSTLEHDYLTDGFWAKSLNEELPCKGLTIQILERMEEINLQKFDVTNKEGEKACIEDAKKRFGEKLEYEIENFYAGNVYYLFVYKVFSDVRLVGAPPSSIGNFGGDTDNWMWPRHGGDFSMFRIYADKNNEPADYSPENVPYKPKQHFKISLKGVQEGDFTMVFGYPGNTELYLSSYGVDARQNVLFPSRIFVRQNIMDLMEEAIDADRTVRLKYTSRYAGVENAKKKWEGVILGLKRFDVINQKRNFEKDFSKQISNDADYSTLLKQYNESYKNSINVLRADAYFVESIYQTMQFKTGEKLYKLATISENLTPTELQKEAYSIYNDVKSIVSSRDKALERRLFTRLLQIYSDSCAAFMPDTFATIYKNNGIKNAADYINFYYNNSVLADTVKLKSFIDKYLANIGNSQSKWEKNVKTMKNTLLKDPGIIYYYRFITMYFDKIMPQLRNFYNQKDNLDKKYQSAMIKYLPEKIQFPDANFTLRFTYGKVKGYEPNDGVIFKHYTTLEGVIEKDNPDIYDYHVPEKLKELYQTKNYGEYADKSDGKIHVCFTGSNHTTGGNSGSPVVNANGELIGINFDRCWQGTMSDINYNPEICRNISVDIRYVVFLIDKLGNAQNIIKELDLVR